MCCPVANEDMSEIAPFCRDSYVKKRSVGTKEVGITVVELSVDQTMAETDTCCKIKPHTPHLKALQMCRKLAQPGYFEAISKHLKLSLGYEVV